MRKLATASNADGSARNESCSHEDGTVFYAIAECRYQLRDRKSDSRRHEDRSRLVKIVTSIY
jgi:hypothetical protein